MNEENNFSFLNSENNETNNINSEPQPVSQDIFSGSPVEPAQSEPAPIENLDTNQVESTTFDSSSNVVESSNTYTEPTPNNNEPTPSFNQTYTNPQNTYEPVYSSKKKSINPKLIGLIGIILLVIIAGVFLLKGCSSKGYGKNSSKYPNKFNNTMYYKASSNEIYEISYYEDKDYYTISESSKKYLDRREYYPGEYKNVRYFGVDIKFVDEDSLSAECAKASTCDNAYEEYNYETSDYGRKHISHSDEGINTKKINGREYKYFIGTMKVSSDLTYTYVVYQTKISDNVYYMLSYHGGIALNEEKLQGFLNIKVKKLNSESDIKNRENMEWY